MLMCADVWQDYEPSSDHLGVFSNALTYMIVQVRYPLSPLACLCRHVDLLQSLDDANGTALLLPAWPCDWDASFRVHAPQQTIIEGRSSGKRASPHPQDPLSEALSISR